MMMDGRLFLVLALVGSLNALFCIDLVHITLPLTFVFDGHKGIINVTHHPDICIAVKTVRYTLPSSWDIRSLRFQIFGPRSMSPLVPLKPWYPYRTPPIRTPPVSPRYSAPVSPRYSGPVSKWYRAPVSPVKNMRPIGSDPSKNFVAAATPRIRPLLKLIRAPTQNSTKYTDQILGNLKVRLFDYTVSKLGALRSDLDGLLPLVDNKCYTHKNSTQITTICGCSTNNWCNVHNVTADYFYDERDYEDNDHIIANNSGAVGTENNYNNNLDTLMMIGGQEMVETDFWSMVAITLLGKYLISIITQL